MRKGWAVAFRLRQLVAHLRDPPVIRPSLGRKAPRQRFRSASTGKSCPILANNCFACHGPDEKKRETKFHFDTQEGMFLKKGVIEPGSADESLLIEKITEPNPKDRMPPPESGHSLTEKQIDLIAPLDRSGREMGHALGVRAHRNDPKCPRSLKAHGCETRSISSSWRDWSAKG